MAKLSGTPVKTFSVGFDEQAFNELPYANEVARVCGTKHHTQIVTADVDSLLPVMARHYGEPYGDSSAIPSFLVSRTAREHVTVALNGDGGDELLGGYPRYSLSQASLFSGRVMGSFLPATALVDVTINSSTGPGVFGRGLSRLVRDFVSPELSAFTNYRAGWHDRARSHLLPGGGDPALVKSLRREWLMDAAAHADNPFDRMLYLDNHTYLPNDLLVKMDIASMHCSLEARSPFLDHELAEYCASLPVSMKLRRGVGKYLLKQLAAKTFGQKFVNRRKQGFGVPIEKWLKGALRESVSDVLNDRTLMEPLDAGVAARTAEDFFSGRSKYDHKWRVWALFMYGLWREVVDRGPASDVEHVATIAFPQAAQ
jgi:asparagine synthase (glutamine-hydrolysing)